jgi:hypothetical protein
MSDEKLLLEIVEFDHTDPELNAESMNPSPWQFCDGSPQID